MSTELNAIDLQNLVVFIKKSSFSNLDEAKIGIVLEQKLLAMGKELKDKEQEKNKPEVPEYKGDVEPTEE